MSRSTRTRCISLAIFLTLAVLLLVTRDALKAKAAAEPLDVAFGNNGKVIVNVLTNETESTAVAVQADGKIVVAGSTKEAQSDGFQFYVARYNYNGSLDNTFGGGDGIVVGHFREFGTSTYLSSDVGAIGIQPDGKIVVGGSVFLFPAVQTDFGIVRLNTDGTFDTSFDGDGKLNIFLGPQHCQTRDLRILPGGKILLTGLIGNLTTDFFPAIMRFNQDGSLDNGFSDDGIISHLNDVYGWPQSMLLRPDGRLLLVNQVWGYGSSDVLLVGYLPDGSPDLSVGTNGRFLTKFGPHFAGVAAAVLQPDGKVVMVSTVSQGLSQTIALIYRVNSNGSPDHTFDGDGLLTISLGNQVEGFNKILLQPDGKYLVVGATKNPTTTGKDIAVLRVNPNGSLDPTFGGDGKAFISFAPGVNDHEQIKSAVQMPNGQVVLAGEILWRGVITRFRGDLHSADFDGDSRSDISVWRGATGSWYLDQSRNGFGSANFGASGDRPAAADFTGDGKTDIAVYRPSTGTWYILRSENSSFHAVVFGAAEDRPVPADFDGDARADIAVFRPSSGTWYALRSSDGGFMARSFGQADDIPVAADFDGSGKVNLGIFRPGTGTWYYQNTDTNEYTVLQFGQLGDIPFPADFDGDSRADRTVFRPSTGTWYTLKSSDGGVIALNWGSNGDIPVSADYNGDGRAEQAVFRAGAWYIYRDSGALTTFFGQAGDTPVPSANVVQ